MNKFFKFCLAAAGIGATIVLLSEYGRKNRLEALKGKKDTLPKEDENIDTNEEETVVVSCSEVKKEDSNTKTSGDSVTKENDEKKSKKENVSVRIANPNTVIDSYKDFASIGFIIDAPFGAKKIKYVIINNEIAEVCFVFNEKKYFYRASKIKTNISGVYHRFIDTHDVQQNKVNITLKTTRNGLKLATWKKGSVNYSLFCSTEITDDELLNVFNRLK